MDRTVDRIKAIAAHCRAKERRARIEMRLVTPEDPHALRRTAGDWEIARGKKGRGWDAHQNLEAACRRLEDSGAPVALLRRHHPDWPEHKCLERNEGPRHQYAGLLPGERTAPLWEALPQFLDYKYFAAAKGAPPKPAPPRGLFGTLRDWLGDWLGRT